MDTKSLISESLAQAQKCLQDFISSPATLVGMERMVDVMAECLEGGGKIITCGNGGSMCDATHFAEELTGRYRRDRKPLPAMSINDPAFMSCTSNDFAYSGVFERWVEAFGKPGDVLIGISTSGNSENVVLAAEMARRNGMKVIVLTAEGETKLSRLADVCICAPRTQFSDRIQEIHIKVIHMTIEALENKLGLA